MIRKPSGEVIVMPKLPNYNSKQLIKLLEKNGFTTIRQKGSHKILEDKTRSKKSPSLSTTKIYQKAPATQF